MRLIYLCFDVNKIITLTFLYRYTFYALLKDAFCEQVGMLNTDTDSFFLHCFVEDLAQEINARLHLRDAFDFSEISNGHLSYLKRSNFDLHAGEVGYFTDETKGNPIVKFIGLRPTMYSFTMCDASEPMSGVNYQINITHKAVATCMACSLSSASSKWITCECTMVVNCCIGPDLRGELLHRL